MSVAEFVQEGAAVDYTPTADTVAGSVVVQGDLVGITKHDIKADQLGAVSVEGLFDIDKDPTATIAAGTVLYWDAGNSQAVTDATGNKLLGKSVLDAANGDTSVRVRLSQ